MYIRRARPTLRLLREDLASHWEQAFVLRALKSDDIEALMPLAELPHPIVRKAAESFRENPENDNYVQPVSSSTRLRLLEIKQFQWRGGVWQDPETGVCWLVVAGLAKGGHQNSEDFYRRSQRENQLGYPHRWLPTEEDVRLLKLETAAYLRTKWELDVQSRVLDALKEVHNGGITRFNVGHVLPEIGKMAAIEITVACERTSSEPAQAGTAVETDEVVVEVFPEKQFIGTSLLWKLILRVLTAISPPQQDWDSSGFTFSNMAEPGTWTRRVTELKKVVQENNLVFSQLGAHSHYAHKKHLAGKTIEGEGIRSLCRVYFVPHQDPGKFPRCPECVEIYAQLGR